MVKKTKKKEGHQKVYSKYVSNGDHQKHRKSHRTFRTFYFIFVVFAFTIVFFSFKDVFQGLFVAYMFALASFIVYELMISKHIKNHDLKVNCLHQAYIGLVAFVAAFFTYVSATLLRMGLEDTLLMMTILTVTLLLLTINHLDEYIEKII